MALVDLFGMFSLFTRCHTYLVMELSGSLFHPKPRHTQLWSFLKPFQFFIQRHTLSYGAFWCVFWLLSVMQKMIHHDNVLTSKSCLVPLMTLNYWSISHSGGWSVTACEHDPSYITIFTTVIPAFRTFLSSSHLRMLAVHISWSCVAHQHVWLTIWFAIRN